MKITLVQSPCWSIHQPPLALAYLSAVLRAEGFSVTSYDFSIELYNKVLPQYKYLFKRNNSNSWIYNFSQIRETLDLDRYIAEWADTILKGDPDIIGFSMYRTTSETNLLLAEQIKKKAPLKTIVFGGPSCLKEERGRDFINRSSVDIVVTSEGEEALHEVARKRAAGEPLEGVKGLLVKKEGRIIDSGERECIKDLDSIPFPDFADFDFSRYTPFACLPVLTSRGCIGRCTFCADNHFWLSYRFRTAENIFNELARNSREYSEKSCCFVDSLLNGNINQLSRLCDMIIENNLRVCWGGKATINKGMTPALLKKMRKAGCQILGYGIESGSQKVLNDMSKGLEIKVAEQVLRDTYEAGIETSCFFIIGYPTETLLDFLKTVWFVFKNRKFISGAFPGSGCAIFPGSYLAGHLDELEIEMGETFNDWKTRDNRNTVETRKKRVQLFKRLAFSFGVSTKEIE